MLSIWFKRNKTSTLSEVYTGSSSLLLSTGRVKSKGAEKRGARGGRAFPSRARKLWRNRSSFHGKNSYDMHLDGFAAFDGTGVYFSQREDELLGVLSRANQVIIHNLKPLIALAERKSTDQSLPPLHPSIPSPLHDSSTPCLHPTFSTL